MAGSAFSGDRNDLLEALAELFSNGGGDGEGSQFSGNYNDLTNKPTIPASIVMSSVKVLDTGLDSSNQDANESTWIYSWSNGDLNTAYVSRQTNNTHIVLETAGQYHINTHIRVSNAIADDRAKYVVRIKHHKSNGDLKATYTGSDSYLRDNTLSYDQGGAVACTTIVAERDDYIVVESLRLFSQDPFNDNPADQNLSNLLIHFFEYTLN